VPVDSEVRTGVQPTATPRLRSLPPLDPTTHSLSSMKIPVSENRTPAPRPVLASECLRDDIAPIEPHAARTKIWLTSLGGTLVLVSVAMTLKLLPSRSIVDAMVPAIAGLALAAPGLAKASYAVRGVVSLVAAVGLLILGVAGVAPGVRGGMHPLIDAVRVFGPALLSASLFLRATYRASRSTRVGIVTGVTLFVLAGAWAGGMAVWSSDVSIFARLGAGSMVLLSGLSLLGFMGEETTAACEVWGVVALLFGGAALALDAGRLAAFDRSLALGALVSTVGMAAASISAYTVGAIVIGPRARHKEHRRVSVPPSRPADERRQAESIPPLDE
jgi:hypothetical protein